MRLPKDKPTVPTSTPLSKATQQVLKPQEEEEPEDPAVQEEVKDLQKQLGNAKRWNLKSVITALEERLKELQKTKTVPQATSATKDLKTVAADQHNIQNRHETRMQQLEDKREEAKLEIKTYGEKQRETLDEEKLRR